MVTMVSVFVAAAILGGVQATPSIMDYVQGNLKDATFVAKVVRGDQRELRKINDDFGQSYRFTQTTINLKEPFMLRLETTVDDTDALFILNGTKRLFRVPRAGINVRQDLSDGPGKRQTVLDFGLLTPALFTQFMDAKFVRTDRATGDLVFDLTYKQRNQDSSRHRIWVDKDKKVVKKREWYGQDDVFKAVFIYEDAERVNGVWIPTRVTVRNADDKVAGVTEYSSKKVNTGLSDDLFKI